MTSAQHTRPFNDRILAAIAHASLLGGGMLLFLPPMLWGMNRGKSEYTTFQILQAFAWQVIFYIITLLLVLVALIIYGIGLIVAMRGGVNPYANPSDGFITLHVLVGLGAGIPIIAITLVSLIAAVACLFGVNYHYPLLGVPLSQYLNGDAGAQERRNQQVMAACIHASIMAGGFGWMAPLGAWAGGLRRMNWLKFHTLQSLIWQVVGLILSVVFGGCWMLSFVPMGAVLLPSLVDATGPAVMVLLMIPMLIATLLISAWVLIFPIYSTLPLVAAYRILKGGDYNYPLVGKRLSHYREET